MAKIRTGAVRIEGLAELNRALKRMDSELQPTLRETNKEVAQGVASGARSRASGLGGVAAHVAPSLRATAGATSAGVSGGGAQSPAFGGAEFGGGARPTTQQFQPWRGNGPDAGYFLYPEIRQQAPDIEKKYLKGFDKLKRKTGLD